jgi:MazG family protein
MAVSDTFEGLLQIMDQLRGPDGCPWDREQDYASLRGYLLEEVYEVAQALDDKDEQALCEELGDLLFQIVFLSRIGKENGAFTAQDIVRGIATKMVRRHPHVFGDSHVRDSEDVLRNWEEIKKQEKRDRLEPGEEAGSPGILDGIPVALPALQKAQRIGTKTARAGFFWKNHEDILAKVHEELGELHESLSEQDESGVEEELGDLLFTLTMLARHKGLDAEAALERSNRKFTRRFGALEQILTVADESVAGSAPERLEEIWQQIKRAEVKRDGTMVKPDQAS